MIWRSWLRLSFDIINTLLSLLSMNLITILITLKLSIWNRILDNFYEIIFVIKLLNETFFFLRFFIFTLVINNNIFIWRIYIIFIWIFSIIIIYIVITKRLFFWFEFLGKNWSVIFTFLCGFWIINNGILSWKIDKF